MYASSFDTTIGVALARRNAITLDDNEAPPRPNCVDVEGGEDGGGANVIEEDCWVILTIVVEGVLYVDVPVEVVTGELTIEVLLDNAVVLVEVDCRELEAIIALVVLEVIGALVEFVDVLDLTLKLAVKVIVGETKELLLLFEIETEDTLAEVREMVDGPVALNTTLLLLLVFTDIENIVEVLPTVPTLRDETTP